MMIPDCRSDDYYNYAFLGTEDMTFVNGFDWCVDNAVDNAFNNIEDIMPDIVQKFDIRPSDAEKAVNFIKDWLLHYIESERDDLITGLIDGMEDEEYRKNRKDFISNHPAEFASFFDTRKFICTGKKVRRDENDVPVAADQQAEKGEM